MLRFLFIHSRLDRRCYTTARLIADLMNKYRLSPRSYFIQISILLRLATPTCSPELVTSRQHTGDCQIETRYRVRDEGDDDALSAFRFRQIELFSPRIFLRGLSEGARRHPPVRELVAYI